MTITMNRDGKELTIAIEGRLDTITSPELERQLEPALQGVEKLSVLLSEMQIMEKKGEMKVRNVCPEIMEVFELVGFADELGVE